MHQFLPAHGRTRISGPRKTVQEGVRVVRGNRKLAPDALQGKKGEKWTLNKISHQGKGTPVSWMRIPVFYMKHRLSQAVRLV
jgi:hypothetical protein